MKNTQINSLVLICYAASTLQLSALRGRDRVLAEAFTHANFGPISVRPCQLLMEVVDTRYKTQGYTVQFRVLQAVTNAPHRRNDRWFEGNVFKTSKKDV